MMTPQVNIIMVESVEALHAHLGIIVEFFSPDDGHEAWRHVLGRAIVNNLLPGFYRP